MQTNPYQSPLADTSAAPPGGKLAPPFKLFKSWQITLATFLGSPLAGGIIMALNFNRLGRQSAAVQAIVLSLLATIAIIIAALLLPDLPIPDMVYVAPQVVVMYVLSQKLFAADFSEHERRRGQWSSGWAAAGIGILTAVVIVGVLLGVIMFLAVFFPNWLPEE